MKVVQNGAKHSFVHVDSVHDQLEKGVYLLKYDRNHDEYYLMKKEDFVLPKRIYGDHSIVKRWLKSWENNSEKNMGIILSGIKGSGKTITAQKFCIESDLPVVMITEAFSGSTFVDFLTNKLLGKCVIFIDEFEKIYSRDDETVDLLGLMDGNYPTKLIFLLTVNEFRINEYLVNRLNRIKYRKHYEDLEQDIIDEVVADLLIKKEHAASINEFFDRINMRTFDLLINIIKDMNLFGEDALTCAKYLNLTATTRSYQVFEILPNGNQFPCDFMSLSPATREFEVERKSTDYLPPLPKEKGEDESPSHPYYIDVDLDSEDWHIEKGKNQFFIENKKEKLKFKFVLSAASLAF